MLLHLFVLIIAYAAANTERHGQIYGKVQLPEFTEPIPNLTVPIGRDAIFKCAISNLGHYRVGWVKDDSKEIQAIHKHVITHSNRVSVSSADGSEWYLHLRNVQEQDQGPYMCQLNTNPPMSQLGYLEVVIPPDFIPEETSGDTMVPEGGTAKVTCKARGIPPPRVMWKREDGQQIVIRDATGAKNKMLTYTGTVLKLNKISRSEMGTYLCLAGNGVPPSVSKRILISVHFRPVIRVPNMLVAAPLGTDVTLECFVESSPKSINYWIRGPGFKGNLITPSDRYDMTVKDKSMFEAEMTLKIKKIRTEDLGSYGCVAKNSLGDMESTIRLYDIEGIHSKQVLKYTDSKKPEENSEISDYDDVKLSNKEGDNSNRVSDHGNKLYTSEENVGLKGRSAAPEFNTFLYFTVIFQGLFVTIQ